MNLLESPPPPLFLVHLLLKALTRCIPVSSFKREKLCFHTFALQGRMLDCVLLEIKVKSNKALANGRLNLCMLDAQLSISTSKPGIPFSGEPSFNLQRSRFPDLFNSTLEFVYQAFR